MAMLLCALVLWGGAKEDGWISAKLKARLARSKLKQDGVQFRVKDGVVEWTGKVSSPQRKGAATRMAKAAGAERVVNKLVVNKAEEKASGPQPRKAVVVIEKR
jgi:osmotically-inducible protein OsmY